MPTAAYNAEIDAFARSPVYLIEWTVPGDITGEETFYFQSKDGINYQ